MPINDRDYMKPNQPRRYNRGTGGLESFFLNPVWVIMGFNILIYFIALVNQLRVLDAMALVTLTFTREPWTLLTSMFLHINFWHIFSNMLALFFFGRIVYKIVGGWRFLVIYFAGGLAGNLLFLLIGPEVAIALGASGAVYAIAGILVVLMPNTRIALWGILPMPLWVFVIVFLVLLSVPPFAAVNLAWQAHLGGLAVGLIAGFIYRRQMKHILFR